MASLEFIQQRIAGKQKEITTLEKKLERILKAKETNWEKNPYYYGEYDLKCTTTDLDAARQALSKYEAQYDAEVEKANSRNIPAIIEFLNAWKERVMSYYRDVAFPQYLEALQEYYDKDSEYTNWFNNEGYKTRRDDPDEYAKRNREHSKMRKEFHATWHFIEDLVEYNGRDEAGSRIYSFNEEKFQKSLDKEADAKYDFIIERTNAIVGEITDASNLVVGAKGDLNGYIIGTRGTAKVQTIGAGGYNIQCFHYRTLITPMKG